MERSARKRRVAQRSKAKKTEGSERPEVSDNDDNESNESVYSDMVSRIRQNHVTKIMFNVFRNCK